MPELKIQVYPARSPTLDVDAALALFASAAELADAELSVSVDDPAGEVLCFDFRAQDLARLWEVLQGQVFWDDTIGPPLANASVATCEGRHGWDGGLLLHHYDRGRRLDPPPSE
ncbi:MAG: hypothetical protein GC151_01595 [Betaproteobacteria bacterium]|nr:hypothetical protein [Betaproteobacteria bacterium]